MVDFADMYNQYEHSQIVPLDLELTKRSAVYIPALAFKIGDIFSLSDYCAVISHIQFETGLLNSIGFIVGQAYNIRLIVKISGDILIGVNQPGVGLSGAPFNIIQTDFDIRRFLGNADQFEVDYVNNNAGGTLCIATILVTFHLFNPKILDKYNKADILDFVKRCL